MRVSSSPLFRWKVYLMLLYLYMYSWRSVWSYSWSWIMGEFTSQRSYGLGWKNFTVQILVLWSRIKSNSLIRTSFPVVNIDHILFASCARSMKIPPQLLNSIHLILHLLLYCTVLYCRIFIIEIRDPQLIIVGTNSWGEVW